MDHFEVRTILLGATKPDQELVLVIETQVKLPKKSPLFGIRRLATVKVAVNYNYRERARQQDPNYVFAKKEPGQEEKGLWGTKIPGTPLIENKGERYLDCWVVEAQGYEYVAANGEVLDKAKIDAQLEVEIRPGMPVRRYRLSSIRSAKLV